MLNAISSPKSIIVFSLFVLALFSAYPSSPGMGDLAQCGDNHIQGHELCDEGAGNSNSSHCTSTCRIAVCGDGLVFEGVEACDSGANNGNTAQCTSACQIAQ